MKKPNIWCLICDGHWAHIGTRRGRSTHAEQMKTSVRFQAVEGRMVLSSVLDHSEENFVLRRHLESQIVTNAVGVSYLRKHVHRKGEWTLPTQ